MKSSVLGMATVALIILGLLVAVAFLVVPPVHATELKFEGQVRVRWEGFDRSFRGQPFEGHIYQRARLGVNAVVSEDTQAFLQIQDSRVWGFETSTLDNTQNADFHQAWGQWKKQWSDAGVRLRGGRQELSYGNERILGAVGWSNVGRSFDAFQGRWTRSGSARASPSTTWTRVTTSPSPSPPATSSTWTPVRYLLPRRSGEGFSGPPRERRS